MCSALSNDPLCAKLMMECLCDPRSFVKIHKRSPSSCLEPAYKRPRLDGPIAEGQIIQVGDNRYHIGKKAGQGENGVVYKATDERTGNVVALKQLLEMRRPTDIEFFKTESEILGKLGELIDAQIDMETFPPQSPQLIISKFHEGETLSSVLQEFETSLTQNQFKELFLLIKEKFEYIHSKLIIHNDAHWGNILVVQGNVAENEPLFKEVNFVDYGNSIMLEESDAEGFKEDIQHFFTQLKADMFSDGVGGEPEAKEAAKDVFPDIDVELTSDDDD